MPKPPYEFTFAPGTRELVVLVAYARGLTDMQIANVLGMTRESASHFGMKLRRHLGAKDRSNAVGIGFRDHLLCGEDVPS